MTTSASAYTDFGVLEPAAGTLYAGAGTEAAPGQEDKLAAVHLPVATTRTPVGYTGEQTNPVAGLQHYYARDYQPTLASWIQADTWAGDVSQPGTLSKYGYVLNNPTTLTDVLGNRPCAYEYNNGCHDTPQASFFTPTPTPWHAPQRPEPDGSTPTIGPGGTPSHPFSQDAPRQFSEFGEYQYTGWDGSANCDPSGNRGLALLSVASGCYAYGRTRAIVGANSMSPEEIMSVFASNPTKIFPFRVTGCSAFTEGATCRLNDVTSYSVFPVLQGPMEWATSGTGDVRVSTTSTRVTFTVTSTAYMDAPGSQIAFTITQHDGVNYLT